MIKMKLKGYAILVLILLLALGIYALNCVTKVDAGYAGVVYNANGGIEAEALTQGYHWVNFTSHVKEYPVSTETVSLLKENKEDFYVATKDGKQADVDTTYSYHMDINMLPKIYTKFRGASTKSIENGYLKIAFQKAIQNVTSTYGVLELYGEKRDEITNKITKNFTETLATEGIIIEQFSFGRISPDEATLKSIQAIVDTQNQIKNLELQKQQAAIEADRKRIEAQGIADKAFIEAQGQAKANEEINKANIQLQQQKLTPELVQKLWIDKWDGKLPYVNGGSAPLMTLPTPIPTPVAK